MKNPATAPAPSLNPIMTSSSSLNPVIKSSSAPISAVSSGRISTSPDYLQKLPTPIILGPTGSGKTAIALELTRRLREQLHISAEIISADSRAIYCGLDLGTAKPNREEQALVPHHGLDLVTLADRFTVADWKAYATQKIAEIRARGNLPIIAGGTGLYIDALIFNYHFHGPTGHKINDFEQKSCSDRTEVKGNYLLIGLDLPREELRARLRQRIDQMFTPELYKESKKVVQFANSSSNPDFDIDQLFAKAGNIYRFAYAYLNDELTLEAAKQKAFFADYHLAKRQLTWFKRNPAIIWLPPSEVIQFVLKKFAQL